MRCPGCGYDLLISRYKVGKGHRLRISVGYRDGSAHCYNNIAFTKVKRRKKGAAELDTKVKCDSCGARILPRTAQKYGGLCARCGQPNHSGCLIATATYGDTNHSKVQLFRRFRDNVLENSFFGRKMVVMYYRVSPFLAVYIERYPHFKKISKKILDKLADLISQHRIDS